ncbi:MAG: family peptidase [Methanofollis sp.]|nr:family peptidase [Methanofollis sp.]
MEALAAAVAAGADAVYLGGTRFSARRDAANFDAAALRDAVDYAHARGVAVHATVNTLIHDAELRAVGEYLLFLYEIGVDAVLFQDTGVLSLARRIVPALPVHASTQMTIVSVEGVRRAAAQGMSRVVLARELGLREIEEMRPALAETGIELEVFLHGALCYAYSGQCLLSSVIGGRSGNRGACAQPCRKPYALLRGAADRYGRPTDLRPVEGAGPYPLSTQDICLYPILDRVAAAPVAALKIEGRMKSPVYVAVVTAIYRRALDAVAAGRFVPSAEDELDLALAFNRGFTAGYLAGVRHRGVIGPDRPDNRGVAIGTVTAFSHGRMEATVALAGPLAPANGDGLAVTSPDGSFGFVLRGDPRACGGLVRLRVPEAAAVGAVVSITRSAALEERARATIRMGRQAVRIDAEVCWDRDGTPVVDAVCTPPRRPPVQVRVRAPGPMAAARTRPLDAAEIGDHLKKTGGTQFFIGDLVLHYPGGLFAPPSYLNALRRSLFDAAETGLRAAARPSPEAVAAARRRCEDVLAGVAAEHARAPPARTLAVYTDTPEGVGAACAAGADRVYFEPVECTETVLSQAADAACVPLIWVWPGIVRRAVLDAALPLLDTAGIAGVMVGGHGCAGAVRARSPSMPLFGGAGLNIWNHLAVLNHPEFAVLTLSPELSGEDIRALVARLPSCAPAIEVLVQGTTEAMVTEDCPPATAVGCPAGCSGDAWALRDDRRRVFPLRTDRACRAHIGNAVETCLVDHLPALLAAGVGGVAVDARGRGPVYAGEMTALYRKALDAAGRSGDRAILSRLKEEIKKRSLGGITASSYLRGTD